MICGLSIFCKHLKATEKDFLLLSLPFSASYSVQYGNEVGYNRTSLETTGMIWRHAKHKHMHYFLGYKTDPLTRNTVWHLRVRGSIHCYAYEGDNSGSFSTVSAIKAINLFCSEIRIGPERFTITGLEIGANLKVDFNIAQYINLSLLRYNKTSFDKMNSTRRQPIIGKVAELTYYGLKVYQKKVDTIRLEVFWPVMQELRTNGLSIYKLSDLTVTVIGQLAREKLLAKFREVVTLNGIILEKNQFPTGLTKFESRDLMLYV